jgi:hypothetical protein
VCCFRVSDVFVCSACGHAAFTASCSVSSKTSDNTYVTSGFRILHYVNIHQTQTARSMAAKLAVVSSNISEAGFVQENSNSYFIRKLLLHIIRCCPPQSCKRWRSCLKHCATSRKVADLIPQGITGIFHWYKPSGPIMALGLTRLLTEMSTRNISWNVKAASVYGWQPYHLHVSIVLKSESINLLEQSRPIQVCNGIAFTSSIINFIVAFRRLCRVANSFCYIPHALPPRAWM